MNRSTGSAAPEETPSRLGGFLGSLLIVLAGLAAYANSFSGPFVFDDIGSIVENQTLRHLWPIGPVLVPPAGGLTVSGRPLLNLSFALNYAWGGTRVWGYHAGNLAIHLLAGLTLWGIARRTLRSQAALALAIALVWTLHPLQTEAVSYIVQRAESLMGLCYLLTLYCFIRYAAKQSAEVPRSGTKADKKTGCSTWAVLSILACFFGMATKEVMVSAPVVVLLYDRTFLDGSFREAWRRRRPFYLGLAATWILLAGLVIGGGGGRGGSVGLGSGISWWAYGLTQFQAIARYLRLAVWPHPLVFEYGRSWVRHPGQVLPSACVVAPLVVATLVALRRWPVWGFLGFWFFAILAPTSLVPGTTQMIVEHRMYLALAPLLAAIAAGGAAVLGSGRKARAWLALLFVFAAACGAATARRNRVYRTELALWMDTVAKRPENALAHNNLGTTLQAMPGRLNDAIAQFQETLRLDPNFFEAHNNLGNAWLKTPGKRDEAMAQYQDALRLRPDFAAAHNDYGNALAQIPGRLDEAISQYKAALRLKPGGYAEAHNNLGRAWLEVPGKLDGAVAQFEEAVRLQPDFAEAHFNLGAALARRGGWPRRN